MTSRTLASLPDWAHRALTALVLLLIVSSFAQPRAVAAQSDDAHAAAQARALFKQGVQLADADRWAEATERFRQALALRDSPVIAYNLGCALRQLRQWVEACDLFERASSDPGANPELRRKSAAALDELTPRLGRLTLHVQGQRPGDRIALDAREIASFELDTAFAVDPGSHQLSVQRGELTLHSETVLVFEGAMRELTLRLLPDPAETARLAPAPHKAASPNTPAPDPKPLPDDGTPWWVWAGGGALVAGAVTVVAVLVAGSGDDGGGFQPAVLRLKTNP